jgi:VWFA-related protein
MAKILSTILFLFFALSFAVAQNENGKLSQSPSVSYSESATYHPREFIDKEKSKPKKEKKSKESKQQSGVTGDAPVSDGTITIPVSVFDANSKFVMNLAPSEFKIFADGSEQEILSVTKRNEPVNLILLIDTSPSTSFKIEEIKNYAQAIINQLKPEDKVMVIVFNQQTKVLTEFTSDRQIIAKAISKLEFGNGTSLYEAVKNTFDKHVSQIAGLKTVVLLTDGVDTTSRRANYTDSLVIVEQTTTSVFPIYFDTLANVPKGLIVPKGAPNDVIIQSILNNLKPGIVRGSSAAEYELGRFYLNDISRLSGGRARQVKDINDLSPNNIGNIGAELRVQYQITFRPSDFVSGQRKQITVRVNRPNLFVQARGSLIISDR